MKLKMLGNYKEIPNGKRNLKSIKDFIMQEKYVFQDKILNYLKSGIAFAIAPGGELEDVINPKVGSAGLNVWMTDGKYAWGGYLAYYVEKYNLKIDEEFIEHMKKNNFKINITEREIDFDNIEEI